MYLPMNSDFTIKVPSPQRWHDSFPLREKSASTPTSITVWTFTLLAQLVDSLRFSRRPILFEGGQPRILPRRVSAEQ
jgi:hypothetical protein